MNNVAVVCFWWGRWPENCSVSSGLQYVLILKRALSRQTTVPFDFIVFTDPLKARLIDEIAEWAKPLPLNWMTRKWNLKKSFVFSPDAELDHYEWVLLLDLDIVITGDITPFLTTRVEGLVTCRGAYSDRIGGSVIGFIPGEPWCHHVTRYLSENLPFIERNTRGSERRFLRLCRDLEFIPQVTFWQDLYPGRILSYKVDGGWQHGASIVRFHGRPRPHEIAGNEVKAPRWFDSNWR